MARILLTDGDQRSTLAVVRSLGRAGHEVLVSARGARSLASASRFCAAAVRVTDPREDAEATRGDVAAAVHRHRVEVLIPMTDPSAIALLPLREALPDLVVPFPATDTYELASDKHRLAELAGGLGVPVPDQCVLRARDEVERIRDGALGWPLILKPSRSAVQIGGRVRSFEVRAVHDYAGAAARLGELPAEVYPVLAQRRVVGPGLGVFALAAAGEVVAAFAHRRIREKPPTGGVSVYRESVPVREDLLRHTRRILRHLGWTGVAMVEFKEEASSGTPFLIEINGRFWGSLQLAVDAGVDFPAMLLDLALGRPVQPVNSYRTGVRCRWFWGEVDHLLWQLRASRATREQFPGLPSRSRALVEFLVGGWRRGSRLEILRWNDARPFLRESLAWWADVLGRDAEGEER